MCTIAMMAKIADAIHVNGLDRFMRTSTLVALTF
jgi:hypothetical protein